MIISDKDYKLLVQSVNKYKEYIDKLSDHIASTGTKYQSHYATIIKWARQDDNFIDYTKSKDMISDNYEVPIFRK